jgi:hypothetical protein
MMGQYESQQQSPLQNSQLWGQMNPQAFGQQTFGQLAGGYGTQGQFSGLGQAAFGQPYQQFTQPIGAFGQVGGVGMQSPWALQQRHLTPQDASEVVRQLVPLLPQIIAQAQQQPQAAFGYSGFGQRMLTQHDVNEVVRQILPIVPQIVAQLQGQSQVPGLHAGYGGFGFAPLGQLAATGQIYQQPWAQQQLYHQSPWAQQLHYQQPYGQQQLYHQQPFGLHAYPQVQAAYGGVQPGLGHMQRQLTQQDVSEVVRQLVGVIPQVIQNMQATSHQRDFNR